MFGSFIVSAVLLSGLIGFIGLVAFMWVNSRDASLDDRSYEKDFCAKKDISRQYIHRGKTIEIDNPGEVLKRYSLKDSQSADNPKVKVLNPEGSIKTASSDTEDIVDAEIIEDSNSQS